MKYKFALICASLFCICLYTFNAKAQGKLQSVKSLQQLINNLSKNSAGQIDLFKNSFINAHIWKVAAEGPFNDTLLNFTSRDFRFIEKDNGDVYVFIMNIPDRDMLIKSLACTTENKPIDTITLLGSNERVSWEQRERELLIEKPIANPTQHVLAYKITFQEYYNPATK